MPYPIRRIVTGHNAKGQADVTFDGPPTNTREIPGWPGLFVSDLWITEESPADTAGQTDRALRPIQHDPDPHGSIFRVFEVPPEGGLQIDAAQTFSELRSGNKPNAQQKAKHPGMHRTDTIDYLLVLAGECQMVLDAVEVTVRQGDCIVQRATSHAWVNRTTQPCVIAVVLIDGKSPYLPEQAASC